MQHARKPRVFLSHSKRDVEFIRRLDADLRSCQCEPWIDEIEIRHGRPWLDEIFAAGIPSCDILLCYVTENSIDSSMVKQEIDARLVERLRGDRVTLLLYLADDNLRRRLRLDLQQLQAPLLNESNYSSMFPRLVSEIWRSFSESLSSAAAQSEKVKRLEAEIRIKEMESNASKNIFLPSEHAEFSVAWARIDREVQAQVQLISKSKPEGNSLPVLGERTSPSVDNSSVIDINLNIGNLFRMAVVSQKFQPSIAAVRSAIEDSVLSQLKLSPQGFEVNVGNIVDFDADLLRYGLVERQSVPPEPSQNRVFAMMRQPFRIVFTAKFDRFAFWIEHNFGVYEPNTPVTRLRE